MLTAILILAPDVVQAQHPVDSILIYHTINEANQIRRIIKENFSLLGAEKTSTIHHNDSIIAQYAQQENYHGAANLLVKNGDMFFRAGLYIRAGEDFLRAAEYYLMAGDSVNAAFSYVKIGRVYYFASVWDFKEMYKKAHAILKNREDASLHAYALYLENMIDKDSGPKKENTSRSIELQRGVIENHPTDSLALENMGVFLNAAGRPKEALIYAKRANNFWNTVVYLNNAGFAELGAGNYAAAESYFLESFAICKSQRFVTLMRNTLENLGRLYSFQKKHELSVKYLYIMHFFEEIIFAERSVLQSSFFEVKLRTKEKEYENSILRQQQSELAANLENERQRRIFFTILFLVVVVSSVILYRSRVRLAKINTSLDEQNERIKKQKTELEELNIELTESERKLLRAQKAARLGNWSYHPASDIYTTSKFFPYEVERGSQTAGSTYPEIFLRFVHEEDFAEAAEFFTADKSAYNTECIFRIIDHEGIRWIHARKFLIKSSEGEILEINGTMQDITEAKLAEENKVKIAAQQAFTEQLIESQEEERKRIAGDLHESIGQEILMIKNRAALGYQNQQDAVASRAWFDEISRASSQALSLVREIAFNLRPVNIGLLGLPEAIKGMLQKVESISGIMIEYSADYKKGLLPEKEEVHIYRIVQEAVNNIIKHSGATYAEITLNSSETGITLTVQDNGKGLPHNAGEPQAGGFGLRSIMNRSSLLKGECRFSTPAEGGTCITIFIPPGET